MSRPVRVEFPDACYHVTARGNERRAIFKDDADRAMFVATLAEAVQGHGLVVQAWCLMLNHYHLLIETPRANLSRALGWLQTTYTIRFNRRWRRSGHLFQGRFKAQLVEADSYAQELLRYVHLNPVRPRDKQAPVPGERLEALRSYRWSSHRVYAGIEGAPAWLSASWLAYFGTHRAEAQEGYVAFVRAAFGEVLRSPWEELRGALVLGGESFLARIGEMLGDRLGPQEVQWRRQEVDPDGRRRRALELAAAEPDRALQAWLRVIGGGEKRSAAARALGYADGSAITHALRRLAGLSPADATVAERFERYRREFQAVDS